MQCTNKTCRKINNAVLSHCYYCNSEVEILDPNSKIKGKQATSLHIDESDDVWPTTDDSVDHGDGDWADGAGHHVGQDYATKAVEIELENIRISGKHPNYNVEFKINNVWVEITHMSKLTIEIDVVKIPKIFFERYII